MSLFAVEQFLWDLTAKPECVAHYRQQPEAALDAYAIDTEERELVRGLDVRTLADRGASQMLLMLAFVALEGQPRMPEYLRRMNTTASQV